MEQMQYASEFEMEKVKTTIKQFYRDWSIEVMRGEEGRGRKGGGRSGFYANFHPGIVCFPLHVV